MITEVIGARFKGVYVVLDTGVFYNFERWGGCVRGLFRHDWDSNARR